MYFTFEVAGSLATSIFSIVILTARSGYIRCLHICQQVWSDGIFPNLIFQDPEPDESDKRGTFCLSISPPDPNKSTVLIKLEFELRNSLLSV